ncbi:hypothetical protein EVAR_66730_1 [Eumeta japonica]|uniref:Uncharacterized protein n=1 Tax=Eumeta variegata TaxID=151549 RepID=A0A4C1ZZ67_EUMVA|nr:hypothetical protein EVAR_66730_1 [Eumeta japonica]
MNLPGAQLGEILKQSKLGCFGMRIKLTKQFTGRLCAAAVSLLLGRIGRCGREIALSALSLTRSARVERDNESCFFIRANAGARPAAAPHQARRLLIRVVPNKNNTAVFRRAAEFVSARIKSASESLGPEFRSLKAFEMLIS